MGTLFEQQPRDYMKVCKEDLYNKIEMYEEILSYNEDLTIDQLIRIDELLEQRRATDLRVRDYDAKDEQLAGFGDLLLSLISSINDLKEGT